MHQNDSNLSVAVFVEHLEKSTCPVVLRSFRCPILAAQLAAKIRSLDSSLEKPFDDALSEKRRKPGLGNRLDLAN
jgi:hypothetical protein